jgi:hypothetical protein
MKASSSLSWESAIYWLRLRTLQDPAQRAGQMLLSRFSLLMAAFLCLAPWLRSHQAELTSTRSIPIEAAADAVQPTTAAVPFSHASTIMPFSPWRYRLKSVLQEDSDPRIAQESDLGPVPMSDHFLTLGAHRSESGRSRPSVALRC